MKISRIAQVGAVAAVAALALAGCAANETTPGGSTDAPTTSDLSGEIAGGGASSQEVAVAAWTAGFQTANPDVTITYDPAGSGAGRESFQAGAFPFAGSDRAFKLEELEAAGNIGPACGTTFADTIPGLDEENQRELPDNDPANGECK